MFKGLGRIINSMAEIAEGTADLVNNSVAMGNAKITNTREVGDLEHAKELIKVAQDVEESEVSDAMSKLKALRQSRLESVSAETEVGEA